MGSTDNWLVDQIIQSQSLKDKVEYVPFEGGGEVVTAVAGGQIVAGVSELGEMAPSIDAKKIRVVGVAANQRVKQLPDNPTLKEQGIDAVLEKSRGFFGQKQIRANTVTAIAAALKVASETPEFQKHASDGAQVVAFQGPAEFAKTVESVAAQFKDFMAKAGITAK